MLAPSTPGGPGISGATADILFDPTYINATSFKVSAGSLIPSTWTNISKGLDTNNIYSLDGYPPSTDTNCLVLQAAMPGSNSFATIASNSAGSLWVLTFTTMPGVSGSTVLNLVPDALPSVETSTSLTDTGTSYPLTGYTLSPAPTWNEAAPGSPQPAPYQIPSVINPVDGVINFVSARDYHDDRNLVQSLGRLRHRRHLHGHRLRQPAAPRPPAAASISTTPRPAPTWESAPLAAATARPPPGP